MKYKWLFLIASIIALCSFIGVEWFMASKPSKTPLHIAVVGPMSGQGHLIGRSIRNGIALKVKAVNAKGGINGHPVVVEYHDDLNLADTAKKIAHTISNNSSVVGVIGHWFSHCSIAAGEIYKQFQIPVITPGSTNILVTHFNPWYFRTVFNDNLQGQFISNYVKKVLGYDSAYVIYENDTYGAYLATVFEAQAENSGIDIRYFKTFQPQASDLNDQFDTIIHEIKTHDAQSPDHPSLIFLATHAAEGVQLVRRIKDAGLTHTILGPDSFSSQIFQNGFDHCPKEKASPGYYTNGVYIAAHLIYDTAGKKAQEFREHYRSVYREDPDWISAYSYDTAQVLIAAMQTTHLGATPESLTSDRVLIRQSLSNINSFDRAVKGVTGDIYFDKKGDAVDRPVAIGVYKGRHLISAMTQLHAIRTPVDTTEISAAIKDQLIVQVEDLYMYQTQVIYTGVELIEIKQFDDKKSFCDLDFYLWFRCRSGIQIRTEDLIFTNRILPDTNQQDVWQDHIEQVSIQTYSDQTHYELFRVSGRFQTDHIKNVGDLDRHFLNICFRHKELTRKNLIYVIDLMGMGLAQQNMSDTYRPILKGALSRWRILDQLAYQDIWEEKRPQTYFTQNISDQMIDYSRFHFGMVLQKNKFSLRGLIPKSFVTPLLILTLVVNFIFIIINRRHTIKTLKRSMWFVETLSAFVFMLSAEILILNRLSVYLNTYHLSLIKMAFDIMWWLLPAFFINLAVKRFMWAPLEHRTGHSAPKIIRHFFSFIIYLGAIICIVAFVYEQEISKILATGGLFAMIIGFAVQMNISNLISGIAINFENPFRIGDWVKIGDAEGKVVDITWRSTRILTAENCIFSIPNSTATESFIANFNYPDDINWLTVTPHIDPMADPKRVKKILLDAVLSSNTILKTQEPFVLYKGITEWASDYHVFFSIQDFSTKYQDLEMIWKHIWKHLEYAGIQTVIQEQDFPLSHKSPVFFWDEMELFKYISDDEKESLVKQMICHHFPPQKAIIEEGEFGDSLFFIQEGAVTVQLRMEDDDTLIEINRLGVGTFFGEMAFFSDHYRSASIISMQHCEIYEIKEKDFMPLLTKYPKMVTLLTQTQMARKEQQSQEKEKHQHKEIHEEDLSSRIWLKMVNFMRRISNNGRLSFTP
ncbi:MAG: ABC transporter substrate-binding protein [Candidatus Magnetomorum sp.]|nr:ABC transporter substrate-binding protein [Candidatus Magnetomorum sp.]